MKRRGIAPPSVEKRRAIIEQNALEKGKEVEDLEGTLNEILQK